MRCVDVAIIGGSLAGSTCLRELTRAGVEAAAFDRETFPREKVCGGFLSPGAVAILDDIGMLNAVRDAGALAIHKIQIRTPGGVLNFEAPQSGLAISRCALDAVFAKAAGIEQGNVQSVQGFTLTVDGAEIRAKVVIDAAGKLTRFTPHESVEEFGVQFYEPGGPRGVLDFWFFEDGYGGSVAVENDRRNCCFLITKPALKRYISKPGCRVTGPLAYNSRFSEWISIGDASGMIDPFCGEGMRHALDTGRLAAHVVAEGFRNNRSYEEMRREYFARQGMRWGRKRALARWARQLVRRPEVLRKALHLKPEWFLDRFWQ